MREDLMVIINEARAAGVDISAADIVWDGDFPTIDGMPADEWVEAMITG